MKHKSDLARGWIQKGDSDLADVNRTINSEGPYDTACFHAQQAVEKYLKAVLAFNGEAIPRTHDLEEIQLLCKKWVVDAYFCHLSLEELSDYAVSARYDFDFWPDLNTAIESFKLAKTVREMITKSININV